MGRDWNSSSEGDGEEEGRTGSGQGVAGPMPCDRPDEGTIPEGGASGPAYPDAGTAAGGAAAAGLLPAAGDHNTEIGQGLARSAGDSVDGQEAAGTGEGVAGQQALREGQWESKEAEDENPAAV